MGLHRHGDTRHRSRVLVPTRDQRSSYPHPYIRSEVSFVTTNSTKYEWPKAGTGLYTSLSLSLAFGDSNPGIQLGASLTLRWLGLAGNGRSMEM
jgi:hypothetical protein